jgi:hypothetical protein
MTDENDIRPILTLESKDGRLYELLNPPRDPAPFGQPRPVAFTRDAHVAERLCIKRIADERFETELGTQGGHMEVFVTQLRRPLVEAKPSFEEDPDGVHFIVRVPADMVVVDLPMFPSLKAFRTAMDESIEREAEGDDDEEEEEKPNGQSAAPAQV